MAHPPSPGRRRRFRPYRHSVGLSAAFAFAHLASLGPRLEPLEGGGRALLLIKGTIEVLACAYVVITLLKCLDYLLNREAGTAAARPAEEVDPSGRSVAVVYLCAGDLDRRALASLCALEHPGLRILVHDDSEDPEVQAEVDATARDLRVSTGADLRVLRRPEKGGGKPGAVNHVLRQLEGDTDFFLLCDNDSVAVDPGAIRRALPYFEDPRTAVVQFRSVGLPAPEDGHLNRSLLRSIEVFDLFAHHQARYGLMPFLGHNALLRTDAVLEAGGMTPGFFADDIDLTVRLVQAGHCIRYAPEIEFGETHPSDYASFRRRAFKWAFGCGQVMRTHLAGVLRSRELGRSQKLGFLDFTGFYALQLLLIVYLAISFLIVPLVLGDRGPVGPVGVLGSSLVVLVVFLPVLSFLASGRRLREGWPFAWVCCLVYGSVAFVTARGVLAGLRNRPRKWIPTNAAGARGVPAGELLLEASFGVALVAVPALLWPGGLLQPAPHLFAAVLVSGLLLASGYVPRGRPRPAPAWIVAGMPRTALLLVSLFLLVGLAPRHRPPAAADSRVAIAGDRFVVDGAPFLVEGVHYSPWRPGTGPAKGYPWPSDEEIEEDLDLVAGLGANTILVHDAPPRLLDLAAERDLMVVLTYYLNWQTLDDDAVFDRRADEVVEAVRSVADHRNLLAILLGNEVVEWVRNEMGDELIEERLRELDQRVESVAPEVPVSHANWPVTRGLDLDFLDFVAFNLYPAWPREVVVRGYGSYITEVLEPLADGRPLLISEFGQNTLEASEAKQAEVLQECWKEIRARTAGGVVFELTDEWWKNYDNPVDGEDWWTREHAPNDELTHDIDPEEHYGIFTVGRTPKPAAATVRRMFSEREQSGSTLFLFLPLGMLTVYTLFVLVRSSRADRRALLSTGQSHSTPSLLPEELR